MEIQLLLTGDELMTGVTVDSNSAMIAHQLADLGLSVTGKVTIGDQLDLLINELRRLTGTADVLIVNGGLGPTVDDLTAAAVAEAANAPLQERTEVMAHLEQWLAERGVAMNAANRKQAALPSGSEILPNPVGSAVGFSLELNGCLVLCTPGVPSELERMMREQVLPRLEQRFPGVEPVRQSRFHLFGIGESALQQRLSDDLPDWPPSLDLGFRAGLPTLEVKLTSRRREDESLHDAWHRKLENLLNKHIVASGDSSLADALLTLLQEQNRKLVTVETGTGGTLAQMLCGQRGADEVLAASLIIDSERAGNALLDMPEVGPNDGDGESRARALAAGALATTGADLALAIHCTPASASGAGNVRVAWGADERIQARALDFRIGSGRTRILAAAAGVDLLRRTLLGVETVPDYFADMRAASPARR